MLSACGKGCYGRLGLGDSSNQPIPKQLPISPDIRFKCVSSSKGSDGHTLALTTTGQVYSWGDGKLAFPCFNAPHIRYALYERYYFVNFNGR